MNIQDLTPPPGLVQEWACASPIQANDENWGYELYIADNAARWGADAELEACCKWLMTQNTQSAKWFDRRHEAGALVSDLRAARRPKPLSLKELALEALAEVHHAIDQPIANTIRLALEALPND